MTDTNDLRAVRAHGSGEIADAPQPAGSYETARAAAEMKEEKRFTRFQNTTTAVVLIVLVALAATFLRALA